MDKLYVIKIGGNIIDDENALSAFINEFSELKGNKILVHGGGKTATNMAERLQIPQQMIEGRRITDAETLKIVTMVYAGLINKKIVAALQAENCNALGMSGADGNLVLARKRENVNQDYGFAGDVKKVNKDLLLRLFEKKMTPVLCAITHNGKGQLLNTNADTMAQEIAKSLAGSFETILIYGFEKAGVLRDVKDESSIISSISEKDFNSLKENGIVSEGMIPKLENAFEAIQHGVSKVILGPVYSLQKLINGEKGTVITA